VGAFVALCLTTVTSLAVAYAGHRFDLAHIHLIGGIPVGALFIGGCAAIGTALAVRLFAIYDTSGMRVFAQFGGLMAYSGAVLLDYVAAHPNALLAPLTAQALESVKYLQTLVEQGSAAFARQLPGWVRLPVEVGFWVGGARLVIEMVGAVVATGWMLSMLTDVPFCWKNRRFYELRQLIESANMQAVREWEMAMNQRRPVEARAILARVRQGRVRPEDRRWVRIVVHQCPVCHASRLRIEGRRRGAGFARTETSQEITLDPVRGAALLAT